MAASRLRPQVEAQAIVASASASFWRSPVSLASGRIRSPSAAEAVEIADDEVEHAPWLREFE